MHSKRSAIGKSGISMYFLLLCKLRVQSSVRLGQQDKMGFKKLQNQNVCEYDTRLNGGGASLEWRSCVTSRNFGSLDSKCRINYLDAPIYSQRNLCLRKDRDNAFTKSRVNFWALLRGIFQNALQLVFAILFSSNMKTLQVLIEEQVNRNNTHKAYYWGQFQVHFSLAA